MGCDKKHIGLRVRYTYSISNFSERGYVTILEPGDSTRFCDESRVSVIQTPQIFRCAGLLGLSLACGSLDSCGSISTYSTFPDSTWKWYTFSLYESEAAFYNLQISTVWLHCS